MAELKPCPFCGGEAEKRWGHDIDNNITYAVVCKVCHTGIFRANIGQNEWDAYGSMYEAVEAWDRREQPTVERKKGKWIRPSRPKTYERFCSECQEKAWYCGTGDYNFCPNCGADMRGTEK